MSNILDELYVREDDSLEKILNKLLDDTNIELKTEIHKPINLTRLEILGMWLEIEKLTKSSKLVNAFVLFYRKNMVSFDRKSRTEIISAITEGLKGESRGFADRLLGNAAGEDVK
ncbi:MAG: hypothetical protein R6V50_02275 [Thermoplasmatota archaeon]